MGNTLRHVVAAISPDAIDSFPSAAIRRIWKNFLLPAKASLARAYGVRLSAIDIAADFGSPSHRRFDDILAERGFALPAKHSVRFLVSDSGWDTLPTLASDNPLLILLELKELEKRWSRSAINPNFPIVSVHSSNLTKTLADIALDLSITNGFFHSRIIGHIVESAGGIENFFKLKTSFGLSAYGHDADASPYISYSHLARKDGSFGSHEHLNEFINLWDRFFWWADSRVSLPRELIRTVICDYPNFGGQLSPDFVGQALRELPKGSHILFVQRKSPHHATPSHRDEIHATFSSLDVRGRGGKPFGFFLNGLPDPAVRLVEKGAAYSLRIFVGDK